MTTRCKDHEKCPNGNCPGCLEGKLHCQDSRCYPNCRGCSGNTALINSNYNDPADLKEQNVSSDAATAPSSTSNSLFTDNVLLAITIIILVLCFIAYLFYVIYRRAETQSESVVVTRAFPTITDQDIFSVPESNSETIYVQEMPERSVQTLFSKPVTLPAQPQVRPVLSSTSSTLQPIEPRESSLSSLMSVPSSSSQTSSATRARPTLPTPTPYPSLASTLSPSTPSSASTLSSPTPSPSSTSTLSSPSPSMSSTLSSPTPSSSSALSSPTPSSSTTPSMSSSTLQLISPVSTSSVQPTVQPPPQPSASRASTFGEVQTILKPVQRSKPPIQESNSVSASKSASKPSSGRPNISISSTPNRPTQTASSSGMGSTTTSSIGTTNFSTPVLSRSGVNANQLIRGFI